MGILWIFTKSEPVQADRTHTSDVLSFQENLFRVLRIKSVWLLGLAQLCYTGCLAGVIGYLPLYLRDIGWTPASADGTLAACNAAGMLAAIPLSIIAGKLGVRKGVLLLTFAITFVCVSLLSVIDNGWVWLLIVLIGLLRDGYFAIVVTIIMETDGIGVDYAGSATGMVWSLGSLGYFIAPPLGNSLASIAPGMPFLFWGVLVFASIPVMWRVGKVKYQDVCNQP
jgi:cyanate permease